jgi:hypothetical protein
MILDQHSRTGSSHVNSDQDMANATGQTVLDIQRQLDILESEGLVSVVRTMGPTYGALIKPKGMVIVERLQARPEDPPSRDVGFRKD